MRYVCKDIGEGIVYQFVPNTTSELAKKMGGALDYDFETLSFWSQIRRRFLGGMIFQALTQFL